MWIQSSESEVPEKQKVHGYPNLSSNSQDEAHISKCIKCMYTKKAYDIVGVQINKKPQKPSKIELLIQTSFNRLVCARNPTKIEYHHVQSHRIHGWYTYIWLIFVVNVGKYTNLMDPIKNVL